MTRITVVQEDITQLEVDAIVNAANEGLWGGGGVDGAIHRAGGSAIMAACDVIRETQGGCPTGEAVITTAGRLKAKYVIHTVGPVWQNGLHGERELLSSAYRSSLQLTRDHALNTVAFSNISTGVYGFPKKDAAEIAVRTVRLFLEENALPGKVIFCCFDDENYSLYQKLLL